MDRLLLLFGLALLLALVPAQSAPGSAAEREAQPAFFSMLFPQLMPGMDGCGAATPGEAVAL